MRRSRAARTVAAISMALVGSAKAAETNSFSLSSKGWQATLVQNADIGGVTTLTGAVTEADMRESCERDAGGETIQYGGKLTVEQCVRKHLPGELGKIHTAKVDCSAKTVQTSWGRRLALLKWNGGAGTWRPLRGDNGEVGSSTIDSLFSAACPALAPGRSDDTSHAQVYHPKYPFDGVWARSPAGCRMSSSEERVVIGKSAFQAYEHECVVQTVTRRGSEFQLKAVCASEGNIVRDTVPIRMSSPRAAFIKGELMVRCAR